MFGHLALSGVPEEAIQVLFHFGISSTEQLELLNSEILDKMDLTDAELQGLIL